MEKIFFRVFDARGCRVAMESPVDVLRYLDMFEEEGFSFYVMIVSSATKLNVVRVTRDQLLMMVPA